VKSSTVNKRALAGASGVDAPNIGVVTSITNIHLQIIARMP